MVTTVIRRSIWVCRSPDAKGVDRCIDYAELNIEFERMARALIPDTAWTPLSTVPVEGLRETYLSTTDEQPAVKRVTLIVLRRWMSGM